MIHTVGPIAQGGVGETERNALRLCYRNSLQAAADNAARSVVRTDRQDERSVYEGENDKNSDGLKTVITKTKSATVTRFYSYKTKIMKTQLKRKRLITCGLFKENNIQAEIDGGRRKRGECRTEFRTCKNTQVSEIDRGLLEVTSFRLW